MNSGWSCFTCSDVSNRFNHHGICLNNSEVLLLGGVSRKEERCLPLVLKVTSQNEFRKSKSESICSVNIKQRKRSSTDNPATYKRKKCAINITDNQAISSDHPLKRSPTRKDLVLYQRNFDIPLSFENQDVFSGLACAYEQRNKLLFIGGGYDITKKEFSRIAQVFEYDGRTFHPAFDHISDLPTTANVGCSVTFNISMEEKAVYLFGGQEDWLNTDVEKWEDPKNNFSNRVFRLDLTKGSWKELNTKGSSEECTPSPRSQSYCFIRKKQLYVYGGYDGQNIFSDLHCLDLTTLEWHLIDTDKSTRPKEYKGLLKPPDEAQPVNYKPLAAVTGKHLFVVGENWELFYFDLVQLVWNQLPSNLLLSESKFGEETKTSIPKINSTIAMEKRKLTQHIKSRLGADLIISDKTLFVTGGKDQNSNNDNLLVLYYNLPRKLDWSIERLLWLACFKNNVTSDGCFLSQCPPMIIYKIISFINTDIFIM